MALSIYHGPASSSLAIRLDCSTRTSPDEFGIGSMTTPVNWLPCLSHVQHKVNNRPGERKSRASALLLICHGVSISLALCVLTFKQAMSILMIATFYSICRDCLHPKVLQGLGHVPLSERHWYRCDEPNTAIAVDDNIVSFSPSRTSPVKQEMLKSVVCRNRSRRGMPISLKGHPTYLHN